MSETKIVQFPRHTALPTVDAKPIAGISYSVDMRSGRVELTEEARARATAALEARMKAKERL